MVKYDLDYQVDLGLGHLDSNDDDYEPDDFYSLFYYDYYDYYNNDSYADFTADNHTSDESYMFSCTMSSLLESPYATWINVALMLYKSAKHDIVTVGDLLQYSHDTVNTYLKKKESGYKGFPKPVYPNNFLSLYLPDLILTVLDMMPSNLTADEIGKYANNGSFGIAAIEDNFKKPVITLSNCSHEENQNEIAYYTCRENMFHSNLFHALRVLKYTVQAAHSKIHPHEKAAEDYRWAQDWVKDFYDIRKRRDFYETNNCLQFDPALRYCRFGKEDHDIYKKSLHDDNCTLFRRTFGVKGISYEFNPGQNFFDIYSDKNLYNKMIYSNIFQEDTYFHDKANISLDSGKILDFFIYPDSLERCCLKDVTHPQLAIHHPTKIRTERRRVGEDCCGTYEF